MTMPMIENPYVGRDTINMNDKQFLEWIYDRLISVHGENSGYDYMHKLNSIVNSIDENEPKPKTRTEYVKVEFNKDYDALKAFHSGDKFFVKSKDGNYYPVKHPHRLVKAFHDDRLYCVIEKEVSWWDEVVSFLDNANLPIEDANWSVGGRFITNYDFLDMCRTALRATGELE